MANGKLAHTIAPPALGHTVGGQYAIVASAGFEVEGAVFGLAMPISTSMGRRTLVVTTATVVGIGANVGALASTLIFTRCAIAFFTVSTVKSQDAITGVAGSICDAVAAVLAWLCATHINVTRLYWS